MSSSNESGLVRMTPSLGYRAGPMVLPTGLMPALHGEGPYASPAGSRSSPVGSMSDHHGAPSSPTHTPLSM